MKRGWIAAVIAAACGGGSSSQLAAPTGVSAAANADGSITVSWTAVSGSPTYLVMRGANAGAESTTPIATTNATTYTDLAGGLSGGVTYYYKVVAQASGSSNSPPSAEVHATAGAHDCQTACQRVIACISGATYGYGFG